MLKNLTVSVLYLINTCQANPKRSSNRRVFPFKWQTLQIGHIFVSRPAPEDFEGIIAPRKVVLDLVAVLSADYLGVLDKLNDAFDEIYVPQPVLNEINQELLDEQIPALRVKDLSDAAGTAIIVIGNRGLFSNLDRFSDET